jgi:hypothetical protein
MGRGQGADLGGGAPDRRPSCEREMASAALDEARARAVAAVAARLAEAIGPAPVIWPTPKHERIVEVRSDRRSPRPWERGHTVPDQLGKRWSYLFSGPDQTITFSGGGIPRAPEAAVVLETYAALVADGCYSLAEALGHMLSHFSVHRPSSGPLTPQHTRS